jgi:P4 family phage/plasmid primase-like protien
METAFKIIDRLKCNADKKSILKECADLFKDRNFLQRLDNTPMLLGCLNGVVDFNTNTFRRGLPEDYISKSTQINYIPLSDPVHVDIRPEIDDFMEKIFPMEDLREYMWNHLSASLVGVPHKNQKMHFYLGKGSNGKSVLTELMKQTFGSETSSYFVEANIGLVTRPRGTPGQASPETIALKGTRYAVMNEPASNDCIYEGRMKELVSGVESITGRHLYKNEESFKPQYSMVMCCNEFPTIKGSDHGTWRRVVVVDFISQFSDNPQPTPENPYQYRADHELLSRLPVWRETFLAMLVERAFRNFGAFSPCKTVEEATKRFKQRDDFICNFVGERIQKQTGRRLTKIALNEEFDLWFKNNGDGKKPKLRQLHEMMDTKFGKVRNEGWMDCCVVEIDEEMNFPQGEEENTFVGQDFVEEEDD